MPRIYYLFLGLLSTLVSTISCQNDTYQFNQGFIFGTEYHIQYKFDHDIQAEIQSALDEVNHSLSTYDSTSVVSLINKNISVELDTHFVVVFKRSQEISAETKGMFDISVGPLVNAWGFGFKGKQFPDSVQILNLLPRIGYQKIKIVDGKIIKDRPDIEIDPSSAAEGYGVDVVANLLEKKGIENYLVEIGGEIRSKGINSKGKKWTVGIDKPIEGEYNATGEIQEIVSIDSGAISTSGNYRKFYYRDGKKYAHVINPHTGYPSEHQILSVTVYADDCMSADAYSTVFMVMGLESTQMFLKSHPELSAYIISSKDTNSYSIWMSDSFKELVSKP